MASSSHGGRRKDCGRKKIFESSQERWKMWQDGRRRVNLKWNVYRSWAAAKRSSCYSSCTDSEFASHLLDSFEMQQSMTLQADSHLHAKHPGQTEDPHSDSTEQQISAPTRPRVWTLSPTPDLSPVGSYNEPLSHDAGEEYLEACLDESMEDHYHKEMENGHLEPTPPVSQNPLPVSNIKLSREEEHGQELRLVQETKIICSLDMLLQLFVESCRSPGCVRVPSVSHHIVGATVIINWSCPAGHKGRFCSSHEVNEQV